MVKRQRVGRSRIPSVRERHGLEKKRSMLLWPAARCAARTQRQMPQDATRSPQMPPVFNVMFNRYMPNAMQSGRVAGLRCSKNGTESMSSARRNAAKVKIDMRGA